MLNITGAIRAKIRLNFHSEGFCESVVNIKQILTPTVCDVKGFSCSFMACQAHFQVGFDNIFNVGKIPTLASITIDGRHLTMEELTDELRNNRSICAVRVLTTSEHVKIPKAISI